MTQEERDILLKDLSARLFYGVIVKQYSSINGYVNNNGETIDIQLNELIHSIFERKFLAIRPYLRSMSSMTEEESKEYRMFIDYSYNDFTSESFPCVYVDKINDYLDWLNSHHFDYRGLIEKGLALEAPKGMYKI